MYWRCERERVWLGRSLVISITITEVRCNRSYGGQFQPFHVTRICPKDRGNHQFNTNFVVSEFESLAEFEFLLMEAVAETTRLDQTSTNCWYI